MNRIFKMVLLLVIVTVPVVLFVIDNMPVSKVSSGNNNIPVKTLEKAPVAYYSNIAR